MLASLPPNGSPVPASDDGGLRDASHCRVVRAAFVDGMAVRRDRGEGRISAARGDERHAGHAGHASGAAANVDEVPDLQGLRVSPS